jgi:hypothetical protein
MIGGLLQGLLAARTGQLAGIRSAEEINRARQREQADLLERESNRTLRGRELEQNRLSREAELNLRAMNLQSDERRDERRLSLEEERVKNERRRLDLTDEYQDKRINVEERKIKAKAGGGTKAGAKAPRPTESDKMRQRVNEIMLTNPGMKLEDANAQARLEFGKSKSMWE